MGRKNKIKHLNIPNIDAMEDLEELESLRSVLNDLAYMVYCKEQAVLARKEGRPSARHERFIKTAWKELPDWAKW